ncbi:hypothetical protein C9I98_07395 [Photobacterium sanctipauli]|uniref:Uncharacterized protein n=1 Tax=Photobacterium sanctipauli TaxID=1342794 RepID=A0A2T3NWI8_9GAMM|nr:hypothetical protein C9I98_07395 [Photobacterium sanctipauli]
MHTEGSWLYRLSLIDFQPLFMSLAPTSVGMLLFALNRKKMWLAKLSLAGMVLAVIFLVLFQYLDYKYLESCLMQGEGYNPFHNTCIKLSE